MGYEIYLRDPSRGGDLWDRVMEAGKPHDIRPIAPCEARRIEAGIFNYGSDMTIANNPFEVMGLERLVEPQDADYIGKAALERIRPAGRLAEARRHRGAGRRAAVRARRDAARAPSRRGGRHRHGPHLEPAARANIGYVWLPIELSGPGTELEIVAPDGALWPATSAAIPFLDAKKDIPKG